MEIKRLTKEELQDFERLKGCKIKNLYYRDIYLLQNRENNSSDWAEKCR